MPTQRVNDRNRERKDDDQRGFEDARQGMAESRAETQAAAEAFGERELDGRRVDGGAPGEERPEDRDS